MPIIGSASGLGCKNVGLRIGAVDLDPRRKIWEISKLNGSGLNASRSHNSGHMLCL